MCSPSHRPLSGCRCRTAVVARAHSSTEAGGAAAVFWAVGDVVVGGRSVLLKDGLSWGAGEGAMATAVLMALDVLLPRRRRVKVKKKKVLVEKSGWKPVRFPRRTKNWGRRGLLVQAPGWDAKLDGQVCGGKAAFDPRPRKSPSGLFFFPFFSFPSEKKVKRKDETGRGRVICDV